MTKKLYRLTFFRTNYTLSPVAKQSADVIFYSDKSLGEGNPHQSAVSEDAWAAMSAQNPHWDDAKFPVAGVGGWSSVMTEGDIELIDIDLAPDLGVIGEGKPRIAETFKYNNSSYRIDAFFKLYTPEPLDENCAHGRIMTKIAKENAQTRDKNNEIQIIMCEREEAEFVEGVGVAGTIIPISEITITGRVKWDAVSIKKARDEYQVINESPFNIRRFESQPSKTA
jgi:hypothetical protein